MHLRNDINDIQNILSDAKDKAANIRKAVNLEKLSIKDDEYFTLINECLVTHNFSIHYTDELIYVKEYGIIPSIIFFDHQYDKTNGGRIYIYNEYSDEKKRELLMHEFVHIYDSAYPSLSTDSKNGYMFSYLILNVIELRTELISMELMMPVQQMRIDLFGCSYKINEIVKQYKDIETSTVLRWVVVHDYYNAHFAILFIVEEGRKEKYYIEEYCRNKSAKDINNMISSDKSIAYDCIENRKSDDGISEINNKKYKCFCYYEENIQNPLLLNVDSSNLDCQCDKMVIIGWAEDVYEDIRKLKYKE
jgi:hypothetical protein